VQSHKASHDDEHDEYADGAADPQHNGFPQEPFYAECVRVLGSVSGRSSRAEIVGQYSKYLSQSDEVLCFVKSSTVQIRSVTCREPTQDWRCGRRRCRSWD